MTIGLKSIIGIERSATKALRAAIEPAVTKLGDQVKAAIKAGDHAKAAHLVGHFDLAPHVSKITPVLQELALSAAIFGASQTQEPHKTLFVQGKGHRIVFAAARQMQSIAMKVGTERIRAHAGALIHSRNPEALHRVLRKSFSCCSMHDLTRPALLKAELIKAGTITVPADEQDISDALNAATMGNARLASDLGSSLTTTRLSAYGFLAQAQADGHSSFQITAELDERTCPVCMYMHGKTLDVNRALDQTEAALSADNPDDLADITPWPDQSVDGIRDLLQMDPEELQDAGYAVPPFHPNCRCQLQDDGTVDQTLPPETEAQAEDTTTGDDWFSKLLKMLLGDDTGEEDPEEDPEKLP